jgi:LysM repeat protein
MESSTCPYLGLKTDPNTPLSFASQGNYCHRARPVAPVNRDHQLKYCLSKDYPSCPVYTRDNVAPLPLEIYSNEYRQKIIRSIFQVISIVVLLYFTVFTSEMWWSNSGSKWYDKYLGELITEDILDSNSSPIPASQPPILDTDIKSPNATLSEDLSLSTQESTELPMGSCKPPDGWVSYTVQPTDSLFRLSLIFGISVVDIRSANCFQEDEIVHPGQVVYIPPTPTATPTSTPTLTPTIRRILPTLTYTSKPTAKPPKPTSPPPTSTPKPTQVPPTSTPIPPTVPPTKTSEPTPTLAPPAY